MLIESFEKEHDREELRALIFTPANVSGSGASNWEDENWTPPWFGTEEQNAKEARAFANWTRRLPAGGGD